MLLFEFHVKHRVANPDKTMMNLGLWLKCKAQIEQDYPKLEESRFYRELILYGIKSYWREEWLEKLKSMPNMNHLSAVIQRKLMAIVLFVLWDIWPKIMAGKDTETDILTTLSFALDRFSSRHWIAVGFGCTRLSPPSFMGQIDVLAFDEYPTDEAYWVHTWINKYA